MDHVVPLAADSEENQTTDETPIVSSASYQPAGVEAEHEALTGYLRNTAATPTIQNAMDLAVRAMALKSGDRAIDVGCGPGDFLPKLAEAVGPRGSVTALDHASGFLHDARELIANRSRQEPILTTFDYVEADALALPFPDGSFAAAHTERVLIHLADPDRGLRELRRVVKPGGWVVCVEPDLRGWRIDHREPTMAALLTESFTETINHPAMGLELNRRMAAAGLVNRSIQTLTEVDRLFDDGVSTILRVGADRMIAHGRMGSAEAEAALSWLKDQSAAGSYTSYTSMFIVAGQVPGKPTSTRSTPAPAAVTAAAGPGS